MFRCWWTQVAPPRTPGELCRCPKRGQPSLAGLLALWIGAVALGFVAGSESGAAEAPRHNHLSHGNKRHHTVPVAAAAAAAAAHGTPASLRAGHSKLMLFVKKVYSLFGGFAGRC